MSTEQSSLITGRPPGLVDVLDRILDKGLVIAGYIKISLANIELLTLQIRLLICSIDKAEQIGLDWWRYDRNLTAGSNEERSEGSDRLAGAKRVGGQLRGSSSKGGAAKTASRRRSRAGAAKKG